MQLGEPCLSGDLVHSSVCLIRCRQIQCANIKLSFQVQRSQVPAMSLSVHVTHAYPTTLCIRLVIIHESEHLG